MGPWSTARAACHCLASGAQHPTALVPLVRDRLTGSRDGGRWGGSGWLACCGGTAALGALIPPTLGQQSRTLPHHPGLLPQGQMGQPGSAIHLAPEGPPPASLGTCVPRHNPHAREGVTHSPSPAPAGTPGRVTAGRLHPRSGWSSGVGLCTRGSWGRGASWKDAPHPPPRRRGQVTSLLLARRRSVRRGPRRSLACARHAPDAEGMTHAKLRLQLRDHQQRGWGQP